MEEEAAGEAEEVEEVVGVEEVKLAKVMGSGHLWILKLMDRRVKRRRVEDRGS